MVPITDALMAPVMDALMAPVTDTLLVLVTDASSPSNRAWKWRFSATKKAFYYGMPAAASSVAPSPERCLEQHHSHFPSPEWRSWLENDAKPASQSSSSRRRDNVGLTTPAAASQWRQNDAKDTGKMNNARILIPNDALKRPSATPTARNSAWKRLLLWVWCLCFKECFGENGRLWYHLLFFLISIITQNTKTGYIYIYIYIYTPSIHNYAFLYLQRTYLSPLFSSDEYSMGLLRLRRGTTVTGFSLAMGAEDK